MCGPLEAAVAIATLAGGAVSGLAGYQQQQAMAAESEANAVLLKRQSMLERDKTSYERQRAGDQANRLAAKQIAAGSASGFQIDGSTLDFIESTAVEEDLDLQALSYNGKIQADNLRTQAQQERYNAKSQSRGAIFAGLSPLINTAVKLGTGFSGSGAT